MRKVNELHLGGGMSHGERTSEAACHSGCPPGGLEAAAAVRQHRADDQEAAAAYIDPARACPSGVLMPCATGPAIASLL